jgi:hypothetical protein
MGLENSQVDLGHACEVLNTCGNVLFIFLFTEVQHVGGEEGLTILAEVFFISSEHPIKPRQKLFSAMIRVKYHWDPIVLSHQSDMLGSSNGTQDGCLLGIILDAFASQEGCSAIGELNDHWGLDVTSSLKGQMVHYNLMPGLRRPPGQV